MSGRDKIMGLEGVAGAGKTTSLSAIREAAECEAYKVTGLAPTSRAAHKLAESGIESGTLQRHLIRHDAPTDGQNRLFVIDESSLASTKQMNEFFHGLHTSDRGLLVGDTRQHEAVEAGRPYKQLQEAGMQTAKLDQILRQKDPSLKETVEQLARGDVRGGIANLEQQGRVHEIVNPQERFGAIAREYARLGLHNLRHSLSSWLVNKAKVEPKTVQSILRHSRIQTTLDLYTQGDGDETRAAQGAFLKELGLATETIQ